EPQQDRGGTVLDRRRSGGHLRRHRRCRGRGRSRRVSAIRRLGGFRVWSLIAVAVVAAVLGLYPFLRVVHMAFALVSVRGGGISFEWRGLENFQRALEDVLFRHSLAISGIFVLATTVISLLLGTALAILTDRATKLQNMARNVLVWPAIIAPVVVSV